MVKPLKNNQWFTRYIKLSICPNFLRKPHSLLGLSLYFSANEIQKRKSPTFATISFQKLAEVTTSP